MVLSFCLMQMLLIHDCNILQHLSCDPRRSPTTLFTHSCSSSPLRPPSKGKTQSSLLLGLGAALGGGDGLGADLLNARPVRSRSGTGWVLRVRYFFFLSCQQDSDRTLFWGLCSLRGKALSFLFLHSVHSPEGQPSVLWRTASEDFSQED